MSTILLTNYQQEKEENMRKQYFTLWDLNNGSVEMAGKAVNLRGHKEMRIPCLLQFTRNCKMILDFDTRIDLYVIIDMVFSKMVISVKWLF